MMLKWNHEIEGDPMPQVLVDLESSKAVEETLLTSAKTALHYTFSILQKSWLFVREGTVTMDLNLHLLTLDTKQDFIKCRLEQIHTIRPIEKRSRRRSLAQKEGIEITFLHPDKIVL
jgi:hypothetical protein